MFNCIFAIIYTKKIKATRKTKYIYCHKSIFYCSFRFDMSSHVR